MHVEIISTSGILTLLPQTNALQTVYPAKTMRKPATCGFPWQLIEISDQF